MVESGELTLHPVLPVLQFSASIAFCGAEHAPNAAAHKTKLSQNARPIFFAICFLTIVLY